MIIITWTDIIILSILCSVAVIIVISGFKALEIIIRMEETIKHLKKKDEL